MEPNEVFKLIRDCQKELQEVRKRYLDDLLIIEVKLNTALTLVKKVTNIKVIRTSENIAGSMVDYISTELKISVKDIKGKKRNRNIAYARHLWRYMLYLYGFTYQEIDYATHSGKGCAMHGIMTARDVLVNLSPYKEIIEKLKPQ